MCGLAKSKWIVPVSVLWSVASADASQDTISSSGINSAALNLTGAGIGIGQVEFERPGDPDIDDDGVQFEVGVDDDGAHSHFQTDPKAVLASSAEFVGEFWFGESTEVVK